MNDHYHRPKRKIIQKVMEAIGENPKECESQKEPDRRSELDSVRDVFFASGLDPQKLAHRLCEHDPPDCQSFDVNRNRVGWEVTGLYDREVEKHNAEAKTVKDMAYRDWTEEELVAEIASTIKMKDKKIAKKKAEIPAWPFDYVNLVILTDELVITREMAESLQGRFHALDVTHLKEIYLLLSYDPGTKDRPCIRMYLPPSGARGSRGMRRKGDRLEIHAGNDVGNDKLKKKGISDNSEIPLFIAGVPRGI